MSEKITGLAFKPIFDAVVKSAGEEAGAKWLAKCEMPAQQLGSEHALFSVDSYYLAWEVAEQVTEDPLIGLHTGMTFHPSDLGVMGYVLQNCKDIQQAMALIIKTNPFGNKTVSNEVDVVGDDVVVDFNSPFEPARVRHWVEMNIAAYLRMFHILTDNQYLGELSYTELHFAHAAGGSESVYSEYFQCPIKFSQPVSKFLTNMENFSKPIHKSNENVLHAFMSQLGIRLEDETFTAEVKAYVKECLPHTGAPTLTELAKHLRISESTVKRKLSKEGLSYGGLCQQLMLEIAKEMLGSRNFNLTDVANYLGYSAPSALSRAFRKWTGMTIKEYLAAVKK